MSTPRSMVLPAGVTRGTVELPGGPLALLSCTPPVPTGQVVLVPGYTGSKEDFLTVLAPIAAAGYAVVACDQRGQYQSPGPDDPAAYTVDALAGELLELLALLGAAHVVGHSFGGLVARAAAVREPTAMLSLTLLCSGPSALPGVRAETVRVLRPVLVEGGKEALWAVMAEAAQPVPEDVETFLKDRFDGTSGTGLVVMGDALLAEPDRTDALAATGLPLHVVYGAGDDAWPPPVQADMGRRLGARVSVIEGALHSPAVEQPASTTAALCDFWAAVREADAQPS